VLSSALLCPLCTTRASRATVVGVLTSAVVKPYVVRLPSVVTVFVVQAFVTM